MGSIPTLGFQMIEISDQLRDRFNVLSSQWRKERGPHSSSELLADHPAYREIVAMGLPAVAMILERFKMGRVDHWFVALHRITDANPVQEKNLGLLDKMAEDWVAWGRSQQLC